MPTHRPRGATICFGATIRRFGILRARL
jgi:hypothetical protein